MKNIYFISDTHLEHTNIIKYTGRPFKNIDEMEKCIVHNWNKTVDEGSIVYHLGDFTRNSSLVKTLVDKLNGKIFLIKGNHDTKSTSFYNSCGLTVLPNLTKLEEYKLILSHKPLDDKMIPLGYTNIHVRIHNKELDDTFDKSKHINVSVEQINYTPINLEDLLKKIKG